MSKKPSIIICSSTESINIAKWIQVELESNVEATIWSQNVFNPSATIIEGLEQFASKCDFALIIASGDDQINFRSQKSLVPRDNVIFELGYFIGRIGRSRTVMLINRDNPPKMPSDLAGVVALTFCNREDGNIQAAIAPACLKLYKIIQQIGYISDTNDVITEKSSINELWQTMIEGASMSLKIFAGDASWAKRDKILLNELNQKGIEIEMLCHNPLTNINIQENIRILLENGVKARFFEKYDYPHTPYGIIIDSEQNELASALNVQREPKSNINHKFTKKNADIYDYKGIRYTPQLNSKEIKSLSTTFRAMWKASNKSVVLEAHAIDTILKAGLLDTLRLVTHYEDLNTEDIDFTDLDIRDLYGSCNYVKDDRLKSLEPAINAYVNQGISFYKPVYCCSENKRTILLPPIVEKHEKKYVVVDGTHRLFNLFAVKNITNVYCLIITNRTELPGIPVQFNKIRAWPTRLPREEVFINYKASLYRNFFKMDQKLAEESFIKNCYHRKHSK